LASSKNAKIHQTEGWCSPLKKLQEFQQQFPETTIVVESSNIRVFSDDAYVKAGFEITKDLSDCDVLIGVKEVPIEALIPNKKYFFFSHYQKTTLQQRLA